MARSAYLYNNQKNVGNLIEAIHENINQQPGDSIPLILVHKIENKAIVLFQRNFDKGFTRKKVLMNIEKKDSQNKSLAGNTTNIWKVFDIKED
ncbi:hypothetical protein ABE137_02500 [Brevibacillus laterosporus]|uniref:Uncharacterized protein n=2 Tax=Brevibacillus TaxID=55080 RepID=A0A0F7EFX8_BRELA|nr:MULTISPECIES: hypothetical protein [Brevibacillus]AKF92885.1 hypothetical protein EX87_03820 [Brevibacillus laterosporus]MCR8987005.1 hypothetical protein [Brevibacillus laterosporus]MCZ0832741.1 hypothetical protein [Brevibacillus halotolerans]